MTAEWQHSGPSLFAHLRCKADFETCQEDNEAPTSLEPVVRLLVSQARLGGGTGVLIPLISWVLGFSGFCLLPVPFQFLASRADLRGPWPSLPTRHAYFRVLWAAACKVLGPTARLQAPSNGGPKAIFPQRKPNLTQTVRGLGGLRAGTGGHWSGGAGARWRGGRGGAGRGVMDVIRAALRHVRRTAVVADGAPSTCGPCSTNGTLVRSVKEGRSAGACAPGVAPRGARRRAPCFLVRMHICPMLCA